MRSSLVAPVAISTAMLIFAVSDNFIGLVAEQMSVWQYHAMRSALILPVMVLTIALIGQFRSIWPRRPAAVLSRAFFAITALVLYFAAIPAVGVSLAAAGLFTSPIFVVLISVVVFGERVGWRRIAGMLLGFAGVCLVLEIATQPLRAMALAPMVGGTFYALNVIWTRRYCMQESTGCLAFWNMAMFLIMGGIGVALIPWLSGWIGHLEGADFVIHPAAWPDTQTFWVILAMGAAGASGMALLAIGYRAAPSTYAALFDFSFLLWIPLFAWLIHGETLSAGTAAGMVLIVFAGVLALTGMSRTD